MNDCINSLARVAQNGFDSTHFPREMRLRKFVNYVRAGPQNLLTKVNLQSLNSTNDDVFVSHRLVGDGVFMAFDRTSGYHSCRKKHCRDARNDAVTVCLLRNGQAEFMTEHDRFRLQSGDIYINATTNFRITFGESETVRMIFPSGSMKDLFSRTGEFIAFRECEAVCRTLRAAIDGLQETLMDPKNQSSALLSRIAIDTASNVLHDHISRSAVSGLDIVRERAREYIHDNLSSPDLDVSQIAAYVGASRATLYRSFNSLGGIRAYITSARLDMAKSMIGDGQPGRGDITNIAYACGFLSVNQFGRAFRARYGVSPTNAGKPGQQS